MSQSRKKVNKVMGWGLFNSDGDLRSVFLDEKPIPYKTMGWYVKRVAIIPQTDRKVRKG